jgi:sugar (pentulose or hexulose) kinase
LLDAAGAPLRPAISWMDTRARRDDARQQLDATHAYRATGWWSESGLSLRHLAWLGRHEPAVLAQAQRIAFVND